SSKAYAKGIELDLEDMDCVFSDNYFDLSAGDTRVIKVNKDSLSKNVTIDEFQEKLTMRSIFHIA
ncbi:glycoside hydrolase family 2 protein, partial [Vallitalea guaymasensis]|uniref:glycoside hydrolase family 2 protein n=1 Tax=Vallitalea guaymasensis TaxID=1185412 RepID=UPI00272BB7BF